MPKISKPVNGVADSPKPSSPKSTGAARHKGNGAAEPAYSPEEIRRRAYEIYERRGRQDGADLEDWLKAEREVQSGSTPVTRPPAKPRKRKAPGETGI